MNTGLLNQLESYFSEIDTDQGPVSPDHVAELIDHVREVPTPVPVRTRPRVWIAAATFAIVLVLVGGLVLIAPFGGDSVAPADQPAPTVPQTDEPAPTVPTDDTTDVDGAEDESSMLAIEWSTPLREAPSWVDVYSMPGGGYVAAVADSNLSWENYYSLDGGDWVPAAEIDSLFAQYEIYWVGGDLAVTVADDPESEAGDRKLLAFDGSKWRVAADLPNYSLGAYDPPFSTFLEHTTVLIRDTPDGDVVWVSTDQGETARVDAPWGSTSGVGGRVDLIAVKGTGFVAFPTRRGTDGGMWLSMDGLEWERLGDNPFAAPSVGHVVLSAVGDRFAVTTQWGGVAGDEIDHFSFWTSTDGVNWTRDGESDGRPRSQFEVDNNVLLVSMTAGLTRIVRKPSSPDDLISVSADGGTTWQTMQHPPSECHVGAYGESRLAATPDFLYCSSDDGLWIGHFESTRP